MNRNETIQSLLAKEHELERRLSELTYGSPEVRNGKSLYVHFRVSGKQLSRYVGPYSDELYNLILKNNQTAKVLKKDLKHVQRSLKDLGYVKRQLPEATKRNLDFAKKNLALTIHSQAILEGVATTLAETETIIEGGKIQGLTEQDVRKIINMKHAWEFIMDSDVVTAPDNLALLCQINKLVEEGFYYNAGRLRDVPVKIGGTSWQPPFPVESQIAESLTDILTNTTPDVDKAIDLTLFVMKSQIFLDGNKRTAIIFANHFLIQRGRGLLYVPEDQTEIFKALLVEFYETDKKSAIIEFLKQSCFLAI